LRFISLHFQNNGLANGASIAGDMSKIGRIRINRNLMLNKRHIVHSAKGRLGILLDEA
jgi:hypothetical protein